MRINYSVIIPHRDSLELLKRALSSIPDRNDIQVIVIDNSTIELDFSFLEIKRDNQITVLFSNIDKGAGHARNIGLNKAIGKWVLFLDADDFYNPGAFSQFDKYVDSEFDIVFFSANSVFSDTLEIATRHIYYAKLISEFKEGKKGAEDNLRYWFTSPCAKLIRNSLIKGKSIMFEEIPASNDLMFSVTSGHYAKKIWADDFSVYCMTTNKGSLTRLINKRNSRSRFCASIRQYKFMSSIGRPDLRFNLMATVLKSFRFGLKEFFWYISIVYKEKVNIFLGIHRWPKVLFKYINNKEMNDNYTVHEN